MIMSAPNVISKCGVCLLVMFAGIFLDGRSIDSSACKHDTMLAQFSSESIKTTQ